MSTPRRYLTRGRFRLPVDPAAVARDWAARGFSCHPFTDPPGREWLDFVHTTDELITVVEGRLEVTSRGVRCVLGPGDELYIPRGVRHSVRNLHPGTTHWLYGYD